MAYSQPPHLSVFKRWFDRLIHSLNVRDMCPKLVSTNCITIRDYEQIRIKLEMKGEIDAAETLMSGSLMRNPDPDCFKYFIDALESTRQTHLAGLMIADYNTFLEFECGRAETDCARDVQAHVGIEPNESCSRYEEMRAERTQLQERTQLPYRQQEWVRFPVQEHATRRINPSTVQPLGPIPVARQEPDESSMRMDYTEPPEGAGVGAGNDSSIPNDPNSMADVATAAGIGNAKLQLEQLQRMAALYPPIDILPDASRPAPVVPCVSESDLTIDRNERIGRGSYGTVYSGEMNGTKVAIKEILRKKPRNKQKDKSMPEELSLDFQVSAFVRHANVTLLMAYALQNDSIYLVYEYINGNNMQQVIFDDEVRCHYRLDMKEKFFLTGQIVQALAFLHQCNPRVVHGDVKPGNMLITKDKSIAKLCDLGMSKLKGKNMLTTTGGNLLNGTPMYMAREQLLDKAPSTTYTDVWAMGASMYEIFFEEEVWQVDSDTMLKQLKGIMEKKSMPKMVENPDPRYKDLAKRIGLCLMHDHRARLKALDLLKDLRYLENHLDSSKEDV